MRNGSSQGYTLVEMIVSIAILIIMTGIVVGTYSLGRRPETVEFETQKIASAIRSARNGAFNRTSFFRVKSFCTRDVTEDCDPPTDNCSVGACQFGHYPPDGYGVNISASGGVTTYTVFANLASGAQPPYYTYSDINNDIDETVNSTDLPEYLIVRPDSNPLYEEVEIIFNDNSMTIYENTGSWNLVDLSLRTTYTLSVEFEESASCNSIGKRGIISIDTRTFTIEEVVVDC